MKTKLFTVLLFLLSVFFVKAQKTYIPILESHKNWSAIKTIYPGSSGYPSHFISLRGDTLIEGHIYSIVQKVQDSINDPWETIGYMREDIQEQKVYCRSLVGDVGLMYDFSLEQGDSLRFYNYLFSQDLSFTVDIDTTYIDFIAGADRKVLVVKNGVVIPDDSIISYYTEETWIEGIGSMRGIDQTGANLDGMVGYSCFLICYYEFGDLVYQNSDFSYCQYPNNNLVNNYTDCTIKFYPNPAKDILYINAAIDSKISIYNNLGMLIFETITISKTTDISTSDFVSGCYIINIINGSIMQSRKLIIF